MTFRKCLFIEFEVAKHFIVKNLIQLNIAYSLDRQRSLLIVIPKVFKSRFSILLKFDEQTPQEGLSKQKST